jgi:hypothetical protein
MVKEEKTITDELICGLDVKLSDTQRDILVALSNNKGYTKQELVGLIETSDKSGPHIYKLLEE